MNKSRWFRLLWLAALAFFIALILFPPSTRTTRMGSLVLFFVLWFGVLALFWHYRHLRLLLLGITVFCAGFIALPARDLPAVALLRSDYVAGLRRYEGVTYYWGGESIKGIDCSGLIRRGLIDSLFFRGLRTFDAGLIRGSLSLWWSDCTAKTLGEARGQKTVHLLETPSINALDHSGLFPGDLAVTSDGSHILAYLGEKIWIEADPDVGRVITVSVPAVGNQWFEMEMNIVRWNLFQRRPTD